MLVALVPLLLALVFLAVGDADPVRGLARAVTILGLFVTGTTEGLSAAGALSRGPLALSYSVGCLLAVGVFLRRRPALVVPRLNGSPAVLGAGVLLAVLVALEFVVSVASVPNTWDSMTYHLARVAHWIQNRGVGFYATSNDRQLWNGPWGEYAMAHLQMLSGTIRAANLVQWASGVFAALGVVRLGRLCRLDRVGQLVCAAVALTWPMVVMQATSTQTDLTAGMWVILAAAGYLADVGQPSAGHKFEAFAATALALLTKPTAAPFLLPVGLWWAYRAARSDVRRAVAAAAAAALMLVVVTGPFEARVIEQWHRPFAPAAASHDLGNQGFARGVLANSVRNAAALGAPPLHVLRSTEEAVVGEWGKVIGVPRNDPRTVAFPPYGIDFAVNDSIASAPLHALLAVVAAIVLMANRRRLPDRVGAFAGTCLAGYLIYAGVAKWQPWGNRLLVPFMILASLPVAFTLRRYLPKAVAGALVAVMALAALACLALNDARPLFGRQGQSVLTQPAIDTQFAMRRELAAGYVAAAAELGARHVRDVGLILGGDDWEYPFVALLGGPRTSVRFYDVVPADLVTFHQRPHAVAAILCTRRAMCGVLGPAGWRAQDLGGSLILLTPPVDSPKSVASVR